jgi:hypothetical protein
MVKDGPRRSRTGEDGGGAGRGVDQRCRRPRHDRASQPASGLHDTSSGATKRQIRASNDLSVLHGEAFRRMQRAVPAGLADQLAGHFEGIRDWLRAL